MNVRPSPNMRANTRRRHATCRFRSPWRSTRRCGRCQPISLLPTVTWFLRLSESCARRPVSGRGEDRACRESGDSPHLPARLRQRASEWARYLSRAAAREEEQAQNDPAAALPPRGSLSGQKRVGHAAVAYSWRTPPGSSRRSSLSPPILLQPSSLSLPGNRRTREYREDGDPTSSSRSARLGRGTAHDGQPLGLSASSVWASAFGSACKSDDPAV